MYVSAKGIPVIYIKDDGFEIHIGTHHDMIHKTHEIEQFMLNTDFIMKITSAEYTEEKYNYTKDIMQQFKKIPYVEDLQVFPTTPSPPVLPVTTSIPITPTLNCTSVPIIPKPNITENSRCYIPERRIMHFDKNLSASFNMRYNTAPYDVRFYSKSASPTSPLNIYAKEFIPIHHK